MTKEKRLEELSILIKSYCKRKESAIRKQDYLTAALSREREKDYIAELESIKMKL